MEPGLAKFECEIRTFSGWERLTSHRICFIDYISSAPVTSYATATLYPLEPLPSILVTLHTCNLEMSYFPALPTSLITCWATLISCKMSFPSFLAFYLLSQRLRFSLHPRLLLDPHAFHTLLKFFLPPAFTWLWLKFSSISFKWHLTASCAQ